MLSRFALYFDEVAKRGSIRRASEVLNIAPSAIDRQILRMEARLGVPLFERRPQGLRLTAAGELLVGTVRRWRRDLRGVEAQIDELRGLRRGEVSVAMVEGAAEFITRSLQGFSQRYPGIVYRLQVSQSQAVVDLVLKGEADIGIAFNPPDGHEIRVERTLIYQLGAVVLPDHMLASRDEVTLAECSDHPLVGPDETNALRGILEGAWARNVGAPPRFAATASSIALIKSLVLKGIGVGLLTPIDVAAEVAAGQLRFVPIGQAKLPLSVLSLISASGRPLATAASLLVQHLAAAMLEEEAPTVG
jgi:DNA-binding transcriptional LysR family regulator